MSVDRLSIVAWFKSPTYKLMNRETLTVETSLNTVRRHVMLNVQQLSQAHATYCNSET